MANVYFLPGFAGSELHYRLLGFDRLIWLNYAAMARGGIVTMQLSPDGTTPLPPFGESFYPGAPLDDYFGRAIRAFQVQLAAQGDTLIPIGYDWRLKIDVAAQALADQITRDVLPGWPATVIGYSMGGLVARRAWWKLSKAGTADRIRRVITIGTGNYGSYGPASLWNFGDGFAWRLQVLSNVDPVGIPGGILAGFGTQISAGDVVYISEQWPGLYELMPAVNAPDAASDPGRIGLYQSTWPAPRQPSTSWLAYAIGVWQRWLLSAESVPPPEVLTCVVGTGTSTPYRLRAGAPPWEAGSYDSTMDGDGRVTRQQSILPGAAVLELTAAHGDMYDALVDSGELLALVNDPRTSATPPRPPGSMPGVFAAQAQDAPLSASLYDARFASVGKWRPGGDP
jgi:pimeloyl-ACP methyl ester carboxylesterase